MAYLLVQEGQRAVVRRDGRVVGVLGAERHRLPFPWPGPAGAGSTSWTCASSSSS